MVKTAQAVLHRRILKPILAEKILNKLLPKCIIQTTNFHVQFVFILLYLYIQM